jgi:hypothetical protein
MERVHASIIFIVTQAALVTVAPGPEDNCPSSVQVHAALETHAARWVTPRPEDTPASQLTLTLSPATSTGDMSISLVDKAGQVKLYRTLPIGDRARDCAALADTVAFIVDRYFEEVELPTLPERKPPPPPLPPPPPPQKQAEPKSETPKFTLALTLGRRIPGNAKDLGGTEMKLAGAAALTSVKWHTGNLWLDVAAGIVGISNRSWRYSNASGSATAVRSGADVALLLGWPVWHGQIYAGPLASFEMIWLEANSNSRNQNEVHFGSSAGLRTGYQYFWRGHFFARADMTGCTAIVRQNIATQSAPDTSLFEAPRTSITLALGVGIWF